MSAYPSALSCAILLCCASSLWGYSPVSFLTPTNLSRFSEIKVRVVDAEAGKVFRVTVTPHPSRAGQTLRGHLHLSSSEVAITTEQRQEAETGQITTDYTNLVASCLVEGITEGKSVEFKFTVAPRYLEQSKFSFWFSQRLPKDLTGLNGTSSYYWFYLKNFVDAK